MHKVIIIGGGPVGLSLALCLANQGIKSLLIEKHKTTTNHPKARGVNGRSMELFRSMGLEEQLKQYQMPREAYRFTWIEDFQGKEITRVPMTLDYSQYSPTQNAIISQDHLEQELFNKAKNQPLIDLRFNTEMIHALQDSDKVTIEILDRETQKKEILTADYLIAADGANSPLRKIFNVEMEGEEDLGSFCNIYCEMNLDEYVKNRKSASFMFTRPDLRGTFILSKDCQKKWLVGIRLDPNRNLTKEAFTDDFCLEFVKKLINDPKVEVRFINKAFWTMAALIAKQYRVGRVFFAGDSAHRLPPTGGFGMNTGIQDAHNLAWKLAMVIKGRAEDSLLESYFVERHQIAKTNTFWSRNNAKRFERIFAALAQGDLGSFEEALKDQANHINNILLDLGFVYGHDYQNTQGAFKPTTKIGARAPHCWISLENRQKSILDLYLNEFVLVCHPEAVFWQKEYQSFPCKVITIGENGNYVDIHRDFLEKYQISKKGAVLVRPDGHIAWRSEDDKGERASFSWLK
ncbi:FAD-dependent oxidoreductase [Criblamydia sequanensis]|uniref:FAD-binding monooxygenase n=1 Tax=Candidatus Criblamydia sequanensis CRIB-18 TaxID=1437425 RepID=A0A090CZ25_9BACT|nr:FAD-dependent oxidoreductase [Criblamydia sequanensis]CDR34112.1 FAD-binding monooxygenase [Criblamydia sequanensis CRIB-18]